MRRFALVPTILLLACALLLGVAATAPAPAAADDVSVERAWDADDARYMKLGKRFGREAARWKRSGLSRVGGLLEVCRATRRLLRQTRARIAGEQPSSATGAEARELALRSIHSFSRSFRLLERGLKMGVRALRRSNRKRRKAVKVARRADKLLRRSDRVYARSYRQANDAKALFRQAEAERGAAPEGPPPAQQPPSPERPCLLAPLIC